VAVLQQVIASVVTLHNQHGASHEASSVSVRWDVDVLTGAAPDLVETSIRQFCKDQGSSPEKSVCAHRICYYLQSSAREVARWLSIGISVDAVCAKTRKILPELCEVRLSSPERAALKHRLQQRQRRKNAKLHQRKIAAEINQNLAQRQAEEESSRIAMAAKDEEQMEMAADQSRKQKIAAEINDNLAQRQAEEESSRIAMAAKDEEQMEMAADQSRKQKIAAEINQNLAQRQAEEESSRIAMAAKDEEQMEMGANNQEDEKKHEPTELSASAPRSPQAVLGIEAGVGQQVDSDLGQDIGAETARPSSASNMPSNACDDLLPVNPFRNALDLIITNARRLIELGTRKVVN